MKALQELVRSHDKRLPFIHQRCQITPGKEGSRNLKMRRKKAVLSKAGLGIEIGLHRHESKFQILLGLYLSPLAFAIHNSKRLLQKPAARKEL